MGQGAEHRGQRLRAGTVCKGRVPALIDPERLNTNPLDRGKTLSPAAIKASTSPALSCSAVVPCIHSLLPILTLSPSVPIEPPFCRDI